MIQLHRLEGFYWVARTGGYAKAARAFPYPITQPAVHQQVKKLEAELGLALFERVSKDQMQLTSAGRRLFDFVGPFFERLPGVVRSMHTGEYEGILRVFASPLILRHLMPSWIKRLQKARSGLQIELHELRGNDLSPLRDGRADMAVDHVPEVPADIASLEVATLRPFLVLPSAHPLCKRKRLTLEHCAEETFISYTPGTFSAELQMKVFSERGLTARNTLSAGSADTILGFVESGLGYSLVPSLDPKGPRGRGIEARELGSPKVRFPVYALWRLDTPENPLLDAALETAPRP